MAPNSNLESDYKNNILCKSFTITGIDEYNKNNEIRIYPNPTTNIISIAIDCDGLKSVQILNLNGILLIEETFKGNQKTIDISGLNTGAYLISIKTEDDRNVQKLIKK
jgi:S-ribosylhomocysteine lyase LuxS involved in autoinducer biosynthesis